MNVEFEPVRLGPRRRRIDPTWIGLVVVGSALVLAVVKPWGGAGPGTAGPGTAAAPGATGSAAPTSRPSNREPDASPPSVEVGPPAWADVAPVVSRRASWGIRAIVLGSASEASAGEPARYVERWAADPVEGSAVVDAGDGAVVALGVTFPPAETPLAVRIWLDHGDRQLEWIDARPIDEVPARGAYLFLRSSSAWASLLPWEPGRYRVDVLVGQEIRRIGVEIPDRTGVLPDPDGWADVIPPIAAPPGTGLEGLPVGLFALVAETPVALVSTPGPSLDEAGAWLDLDREATGLDPDSHVARVYQSRATRLGVVLPPASTVQSAVLQRLAPFEATDDLVGETTTRSGDNVSFVAFARPGGATWRPGVYALRVEFEDRDGAHDLTWHVELRPGPVGAEPVLLSATRVWAGFAGSSGILLGTTASIDGGSEPSGIRLLDLAPETDGLYAGLSGSNYIGCGATIIRGRPTVIGFVGPVDADLTPVTSMILFPLADDGPMSVLTATGAVPGLALAVPVLTAEFGGPASYGLRAGSSPDASGYTICIGLVQPGG